MSRYSFNFLVVICFSAYGYITADSNDANQSKLFAIGETGTICQKGTGYLKTGLTMVLPTLNAVYAPLHTWEFDMYWIGIPTMDNNKDTSSVGFNVFRLGFKKHAFAKKPLWKFTTYDLALGLKINRFRFYLEKGGEVLIDKNSWLFIPFIAQTVSKGKFSYHLEISLPLGGEKYSAIGGDPRKDQTVLFISGFEYAKSDHVKFILEYWFTNAGGFINIDLNDQELAQNYNPQGSWISYMLLGTRLSFKKRFYSELGIATHYSIPPFPATGVVLNFGWYFR